MSDEEVSVGVVPSTGSQVSITGTEDQVPITSTEFQVPSTEEGGAGTPAPLVGVVSEQAIVQATTVVESEQAGLTVGLADSAGSVASSGALGATQVDVILPPVMETAENSTKYLVPSEKSGESIISTEDQGLVPSAEGQQDSTKYQVPSEEGKASTESQVPSTEGENAGGAGTPAPSFAQVSDGAQPAVAPGYGEAQSVSANASNGGIEAFALIGGLLAKARVALQARRRKKLDRIVSEISRTGTITNEQVCKLLRVSRATAFRYLDALEKEGKIKQVGKTGKGVRYQITCSV